MKEKEDNVGYYSVIPATVLYNKELKANEKLLYAIITSLAYREGYCFATNKSQRKFKSNYTNQREYSDEFLESFYANIK